MEVEFSNGRDNFGISILLARIKDCSERKEFSEGNRIHLEISQRNGLFKRNLYLGGALVNMYVKCGALVKAQEVFNELLVRNLISRFFVPCRSYVPKLVLAISYHLTYS